MIATLSNQAGSTECIQCDRLGLSVILVCLLLLGGCQKSADQYQVVTEEMSQPSSDNDADSTSSEKLQTPVTPEEQAILAKEPLASNGDDSSESPLGPKSDDPELMKEAPARENEQTFASTESGTGEEAEANAPDDSDAVSNEKTMDKPASKPVQGLINLEEEKARQNRLDKLGLGDKKKPLEPREPKLLVTERQFSQENDSGAWRLSYNDLDLLKILNMEPVPLNADEYLPDWLTQLDGKRVILRGWMFPPDRTEGIKGFIFVRDNQVCCFGPNAKAYDKLIVKLKEGTTTNDIQGRPFDVIGTFKIDPWIEDARDLKTGEYLESLGMLYHLHDAEIVDKN